MTANAFACTVSADLLQRAMVIASTEATRYYLHGVQIEAAPNGGALLIATDGHALVVLHDPKATVEGSAIVKPDAATLKACRAAKGCHGRVVRVEADRLTVEDSSGNPEAIQAGAALIDGTFPDWRRVMPSGPASSDAIGAIDNRILARLATALCDTGRTSPQGLKVLNVTGADGPHRVFGSGVVEGVGVAMPLRLSFPDALPYWLSPAANDVQRLAA